MPVASTVPPVMPDSQGPQPMYQGTAITPVPDPTTLTNELVSKQTAALREVLEAKIDGLAALMKGQFEAQDRATKLLEKWRDVLPTEIKAEVTHLNDLLEQKITRLAEVTDQQFKSVQTQFIERDKRTEQLSLADKTAIAAALQAQKEAAGAQNESNSTANTKMELNFSKLIEQMAARVDVSAKNTDDKINDVKSRLDKGEGRSSVADPSTIEVLRQLSGTVADLKGRAATGEGHSKGSSDVVMWIFGGVGMLVGAAGLIAFALKIGG